MYEYFQILCISPLLSGMIFFIVFFAKDVECLRFCEVDWKKLVVVEAIVLFCCARVIESFDHGLVFELA